MSTRNRLTRITSAAVFTLFSSIGHATAPPAVDDLSKSSASDSFTGAWEGVFTPESGGPPPFRILFTFGKDGTVVEADAGPPDPQFATASFGAWERTGNRRFTVTYKQLIFNTQGELDVTFKGRLLVDLDRSGRALDGIVNVNIYTPDGQELLEGAGRIHLQKIAVEAPTRQPLP